MKTWLVPVACALIGAVIGHFGFMWIARQGFYALALPGVLVGFAGGWFLERRSPLFAAVCALIALAAGIVSEWRLRPFLKDDSFGYFIAHVADLRPVSILLIVLGAVFAAWFGLGRRRAAPAEPPKET